jgi:glycosyltransferase involved in cell wall biosynthesis
MGRVTGENPPAFSIVIPTYNSSRFVSGAVRSCVFQSRSDLEVIVVDDGSSDDTVEVVRRLAREDQRLKVIATGNRGPSAARNTGVEAARGELLSFLDSDDLLLPRYLASVAECFERRPDAGIVYSPAWVLDEGPHRIRRELDTAPRLTPEELTGAAPEQLLSALVEDNFVGGVRTVRAGAFNAVGGFDTALHHAEDYDLWLRMVARGWGVARTAEPMAVLRDRAGSLHTERVAMISGVARALEKVSGDDRIPARPRGRARRRKLECERELAAARHPAARIVWRGRVAFAHLRHRVQTSFWLTEMPEELTAVLALVDRL